VKKNETGRKFKRVIALIGDTHVGSEGAVFPAGYITNTGNEVRLNKAQAALYEYWLDAVKTCEDFDVDTVLLMGDLIQGGNRKENGAGNIIASLDEQTDAAIQLLTPICTGRTVLSVRGTPYHSSIDMDAEKRVAKALGARTHAWVINGKIEGTNKTINAMHGTSGALIYRETAAVREMLFFKEAMSDGKLGRADIIVRGHNHIYRHIDQPNHHYIINPCWQALTPSAYTMRNYAKWQPDIGMVIIFIDDKDRFSCMHFLFPTPHTSDVVKSL